MGVVLHWFLPTNGDSRTDLSLGNAVGAVGEPPDAVAGKLDQVREQAKAAGRELRFGIRLHVITRDTAAEAWAQAQRLLDGPPSNGPRPSSEPRIGAEINPLERV